MTSDLSPTWAPQRDADTGEKLKGEVLALLEARRAVYVNRGRRALLSAMLAGNGTATADDVHRAVELPGDMDPRCLGAVPGRLAYDRAIRPAGFVRSTRAQRHASYIRVWELANHTKAVNWLADHPDMPDPADVDQDQGDAVQRVFLTTDQETAMPTGTTAGTAF